MRCSGLVNDIRGKASGQEALDTVITRSTDALLKRKNNLIRRFYLWGEDTRRSIEWIIPRLVTTGARIVHHARYCYVHVASAFPLGHHYRAVLGWQN